MAKFDIAAGITQAGTNHYIAELFKDTNAKHLFTQNFKNDFSGITVDVSVSVLQAPTIVMAPPTTAEWQSSFSDKGIPQTGTPPQGNVFQLKLGSINVKGKMNDDSISGTAPINVYGDFSLTNGKLTVTGLAVWLDESNWKKQGLEKFVVNGIIIPYAFKTANNILSGILLPKIPDSVFGKSMNDPIACILNNNELVIATSLSTNGATELSGYVAPTAQSLYLQVDAALLNAAITEHVSKKALSFDKSGDKGGDAFKATGQLKGSLSSLALAFKNSAVYVEPTLQNFSGRGVLSGVGTAIAKTVLCPIGTAVDAMVDPKNWDKIVADFSATYNPNPVDIPITLTVADDESISFSVGTVSGVTVIAKPEWSGELIGSAMAAATAGFADLLSLLFGNEIINGVIKTYLQDIKLPVTASYSTKIEGVTITIDSAAGQALTVTPDNQYAVQGFTLSFA